MHSIDTTTWNDHFKLQVDQYARQMSFSNFIEVITDSSPSFLSSWDGNFGFAPYSGSVRSLNLMSNLK